MLPWFFIICSCNHKVSTSIVKKHPTLDYKTEVLVLDLTEKIPENAEVIGEVKLGDTGFSTKCNYELAIEKAKLEARKFGGNVIKITEHKSPSALGSTCHRIKATIIKVANTESIKRTFAATEDKITDEDFATLNVFRHQGYGSLVKYNLHFNDSILCKVSNNFKTTVKLNKEGLNTLWAKTESRSEITINVINGKTYYLRCSIGVGASVGRQKLELVDSKIGRMEFESIRTVEK